MSQAYLSIAIWEPLPGMEAVSLETIRELNAIVSRKQYGHDTLYRSADAQYVLLRCWARLGNEIKILRVYEKLEEIGV